MKGDFKIRKELYTEIFTGSERYLLTDIEKIVSEINGKEIRIFKIVLIKDFGKSFANRKKFVTTIEEMLINYYSGFVQYLKNWDKPAPKVVEKPPIIENDTYTDTPFAASEIVQE